MNSICLLNHINWYLTTVALPIQECNLENGNYSCLCENRSAPVNHSSHHHHSYIPCNTTVGKILVVDESGYAHEKPSYDPHFGAPSAYRYYFYNSAQKFGASVFVMPTFLRGSIRATLSGHPGPSRSLRTCNLTQSRSLVIQDMRRTNQSHSHSLPVHLTIDMSR